MDQDEMRGSEPELVVRLQEEIAASGPITLARFMERALYEPELGYYQRARRSPGRGGDFLTSPEVHPFFGFTIARQIAECWEQLGRPETFVIREYGAGIGGLAYDILAALATAHADCFAATRYELVEVNPHRLADALSAMAEVGLVDRVVARSPEEAAREPIVGVVLANEVADAIPAHQLVVTDGRLRERFVTWDDAAGWFAWMIDDVSDPVMQSGVVAHLEEAGVVATLPEGALLEVSPAAATWMTSLAEGVDRGVALIVDYGYPTADLYAGHRLGGLLRGYHEHTVTDDPFVRIGRQDLTTHVDLGWLLRAAARAGMTALGVTTQADFLAALGLGDLLVGLQGDGETSFDGYLQAQAAVLRLIDPGGLGRFRVLGLAKGWPEDVGLRGFGGE